MASSRPLGASQPYPVGQLVFRQFDSPALLTPRHDVPAPLGALPSAEQQGRWSA